VQGFLEKMLRLLWPGVVCFEWLLKVVSVSGVIGGEDGEPNGDPLHEEPKKEKEKDDKKAPMLGENTSLVFNYLILITLPAIDALHSPGLQCQISTVTRDLTKNNPPISTSLQILAACRTVPFFPVYAPIRWVVICHGR
jgi:hypothetical protein